MPDLQDARIESIILLAYGFFASYTLYTGDDSNDLNLFVRCAIHRPIKYEDCALNFVLYENGVIVSYNNK